MALQDPELYPHPVDRVTLIQTHISSVLLAGEFVYKFKKPVNFGFLDFSTFARRAHFCVQELLLNRRLCPDIYLRLVTATRKGTSFGLDGSGEIVEYGVKMKRLPEQRMMYRLMQGNILETSHLDAVIGVLVPFYERAATSAQIDSAGTAESVGQAVCENLHQLAPFVGGPAVSKEQHDRITAYTERVLQDTSRFSGRIRDGQVRECHGDLHSGNICLTEKVYIFDCIEFNERFRWLDVAADVAFIAMDLDYNGLHVFSDYFIQSFAESSGDRGVGDQVAFYKCYRACVRAKVNLLSTMDPTIGKLAAGRAVERAAQYVKLAESYV
jgi:aminoglycoside phosphotransferase family enzyme